VSIDQSARRIKKKKISIVA